MKRRGVSLLETVALVGLLGLLLATAATTLVGLLRTERQLRRDIDQQTTLARLAARWRADAHAATAVRVGKTCELTLPGDRQVRYSLQLPRIVREVEQAGKTEHRDSFELPAGATVSFDSLPEYGGRLVRLKISAGEQPARAYLTPVRAAKLEAAVGLASRAEEQP